MIHKQSNRNYWNYNSRISAYIRLYIRSAVAKASYSVMLRLSGSGACPAFPILTRVVLLVPHVAAAVAALLASAVLPTHVSPGEALAVALLTVAFAAFAPSVLYCSLESVGSLVVYFLSGLHPLLLVLFCIIAIAALAVNAQLAITEALAVHLHTLRLFAVAMHLFLWLYCICLFFVLQQKLIILAEVGVRQHIRSLHIVYAVLLDHAANIIVLLVVLLHEFDLVFTMMCALWLLILAEIWREKQFLVLPAGSPADFLAQQAHHLLCEGETVCRLADWIPLKIAMVYALRADLGTETAWGCNFGAWLVMVHVLKLIISEFLVFKCITSKTNSRKYKYFTFYLQF